MDDKQGQTRVYILNLESRGNPMFLLMLQLFSQSQRGYVYNRLPLLSLRYGSSQSSKSAKDVEKSVENELDDDDDGVPSLPLLQRPLGVKEPPTTVPKTRKEQMEEMLDQNKRMEHRRHLYVQSQNMHILHANFILFVLLE